LNYKYKTEHPLVYLNCKRTIIIERVMNAIAQNQPKILYLFSDDPRNDDEKSLLTKNRELIVCMVDWDCEL
jgi:hypothetical protein